MPRHICRCSHPLITDSEPDGLDACKRCRGAVTLDAVENLPDLDVGHIDYGAGFSRWADDAIRRARWRT